jgi:hypothetical protein
MTAPKSSLLANEHSEMPNRPNDALDKPDMASFALLGAENFLVIF